MKNIVFENVNKSFGEKTIFENFNAVFEYGKRYCIMGASGRGKTTLFNLILGIQKPDKGKIYGIPEDISAVFQEDRLCEDFSAVANVLAVTGKSVPESEIIALLSQLGLSGSENEPVISLSGGMKRRVAIARCLLAKSDVVILDEPFKGLDDQLRETVAEIILSRVENKTLLFSSHDLRDAELLESTVFELK